MLEALFGAVMFFEVFSEDFLGLGIFEGDLSDFSCLLD